MSQNTYREVGGELEARAREPMILKGASKPIPIWALEPDQEEPVPPGWEPSPSSD
jgi:hypothetical protein